VFGGLLLQVVLSAYTLVLRARKSFLLAALFRELLALGS